MNRRRLPRWRSILFVNQGELVRVNERKEEEMKCSYKDKNAVHCTVNCIIGRFFRPFLWLAKLTLFWSLIVFSNSWPQTKSRVTFDTGFWHSYYALSHDTLGFALHGSFFNHFLIGGNSSKANQILWNKLLLKLPWKARLRVLCQRVYKTVSETGVQSDPAFCFGPSIEKNKYSSPWI